MTSTIEETPILYGLYSVVRKDEAGAKYLAFVLSRDGAWFQEFRAKLPDGGNPSVFEADALLSAMMDEIARDEVSWEGIDIDVDEYGGRPYGNLNLDVEAMKRTPFEAMASMRWPDLDLFGKEKAVICFEYGDKRQWTYNGSSADITNKQKLISLLNTVRISMAAKEDWMAA